MTNKLRHTERGPIHMLLSSSWLTDSYTILLRITCSPQHEPRLPTSCNQDINYLRCAGSGSTTTEKITLSPLAITTSPTTLRIT